jgi:hypothetical protein
MSQLYVQHLYELTMLIQTVRGVNSVKTPYLVNTFSALFNPKISEPHE